MTLSFTFDVLTGEFEKRMRDMQTPIARAAKESMVRAGNEVKAQGRADIAGAGFGRRWQNAFRVTVYPQRDISIDSAAWIYHRIPYAGVFEDGATVQGSPYLWLPLSNAPKRIGRFRMTPEKFQQSIGDLVPMTSRRGVPLLGYPTRLSRAQAEATEPRITLAGLRRGRSGQGRGVLRTVPLFHGIRIARIPKKLSIAQITRRSYEDLPRLYAQHLVADNG